MIKIATGIVMVGMLLFLWPFMRRVWIRAFWAHQRLYSLGSSKKRKRLFGWVIVGAMGVVGLVSFLLDSPVLGFVGLVLVTLITHGAWKNQRRHWERRWIEQAMSFFWGVESLVRGGVSFSSAVEKVAFHSESAFALVFSRNLKNTARDPVFSQQLEGFADRSSNENLRHSFYLMSVAYRQGLPLLPLIGKTIEQLQTQLEIHEVCTRLGNLIRVQVSLSSFAPLVLGGAMLYFQPELWGRLQQETWLYGLFAACILWEGLGLWLIKRFFSLDAFYR